MGIILPPTNFMFFLPLKNGTTLSTFCLSYHWICLFSRTDKFCFVLFTESSPNYLYLLTCHLLISPYNLCLSSSRHKLSCQSSIFPSNCQSQMTFTSQFLLFLLASSDLFEHFLLYETSFLWCQNNISFSPSPFSHCALLTSLTATPWVSFIYLCVLVTFLLLWYNSMTKKSFFKKSFHLRLIIPEGNSSTIRVGTRVAGGQAGMVLEP